MTQSAEISDYWNLVKKTPLSEVENSSESIIFIPNSGKIDLINFLKIITSKVNLLVNWITIFSFLLKVKREISNNNFLSYGQITYPWTKLSGIADTGITSATFFIFKGFYYFWITLAGLTIMVFFFLIIFCFLISLSLMTFDSIKEFLSTIALLGYLETFLTFFLSPCLFLLA